MPNVFVERSSTGLLGNLGNAIKGVLVGVLFFLASFPVLWWNEGRINFGKLAQGSVAVAPGAPDASHDGQFVAVTDSLQSDAELGDSKYLRPGKYVALARRAESWAWVEKKESKTTKNVGGGSDTETTYRYETAWTSDPADSSSFRHPEGHHNPPAREKSDQWLAEQATVGAFEFSPGDTDGGGFLGSGLPASSRLELTPDLLTDGGHTAGGSECPHLVEGWIYLGTGTPSAPAMGDTRIAYDALKPGGQVTLFGRQQGARVEPFLVDAETPFLRAVSGPRDRAISEMLTEHSIETWILRGAGFLLMWLGLALILGPISAVLDVLPFLGSTSRTLVGIVMFPVALGLSGVTIVVSMIAHSLLALGIVMALVLSIGVLLIRGRKPRTA